MAFLARYQNDLFISYAHIDNDPVVPGKPGWVDFFEDVLRKRIRVRLGAEIEIFRDPQLRRFGKFPEQLTSVLSNSAVLVCVISPRYLQSEWCLRELREFSNQFGTGRIIKIMKSAIDEAEVSEEAGALYAEIQDVPNSWFYKEDKASRRFKDLQPEVIPDDIPASLDETDRIAQDLVLLLKNLQDLNVPAPPVPAEVKRQDQISVYLAETTKDLSDKRNEIRTELLQFDCRVLPDQSLPLDADELVAKVKHHLAEATLSVHLLGGNYGAIPESEDRSIPRIQYDLAKELSRGRDLIQLVWMPDGLTPADERQRTFIDYVENNSPEFLRTKIEDLKTEIHKKLRPESNDVWDDPEAGDINVSLFCHEQDMASVAPLYSYLTVQEFFRVKLPLKDAESFKSHKQFLQTSDAVLLYYGTADEDWLVNIWRLIQRQISAGRNKPVLAKAIYAGLPPTPEKTLLQSEDPIIIKNYGQFDANSLTPFIEKIKTAKGGK